ncbi:MAG: hypothetical protein E5Y73_17475 [Mesorhizobium sp.]|uniref:hypothetical protein n=1 Tax=Mesorhizobium sp. TaxID=1871066 RepID=UPI00121169C0|nr:hypothetical protein [Mesorhizobium sp.]TIL91468.1 MAG: hypothetical protein E5Y73_17475 [Mesorhizobium sp.]
MLLIKFLESQLVRTQATGVSAANAISAAFAQAFRAAENASMDALAEFNRQRLPDVTRYNSAAPTGGITEGGARTQGNVNDSGVGVTKYSSETADNTEQTSDNVSYLDQHTKSYLSDLSSDIGGYAEGTNVTINRLSDVTAETGRYLSQALISALVLKNDSSAPGSGGGGGMFGDAINPETGSSYISSWGIRKIKKPSYQLSPTSDDGSFDTSVNVQQPGTNITLNYQASPGESERTARQRAREMYDELLMQSARS